MYMQTFALAHCASIGKNVVFLSCTSLLKYIKRCLPVSHIRSLRDLPSSLVPYQGLLSQWQPGNKNDVIGWTIKLSRCFLCNLTVSLQVMELVGLFNRWQHCHSIPIRKNITLWLIAFVILWIRLT